MIEKNNNMKENLDTKPILNCKMAKQLLTFKSLSLLERFVDLSFEGLSDEKIFALIGIRKGPVSYGGQIVSLKGLSMGK